MAGIVGDPLQMWQGQSCAVKSDSESVWIYFQRRVPTERKANENSSHARNPNPAFGFSRLNRSNIDFPVPGISYVQTLSHNSIHECALMIRLSHSSPRLLVSVDSGDEAFCKFFEFRI